MSGPHRARLADGRWHFQHGPIDLLISADGDAAACAAGIDAAWRRFGTLLGELVGELALLRACAGSDAVPAGDCARRMHAAVLPYRPTFITPMAAVAGAVADTVLQAFVRPGIARAAVDNGGDIALHVAPGAGDYTVGVAIDTGGPRSTREVPVPWVLRIRADDPWRGVATSGWRGRSLSLGIADSVTVVAADGARADAAATMIANAIDVDHPAVRRARACDVRDDTDLGTLPVTVGVGPLPDDAIERALNAGQARARGYIARGLAAGALLVLAGRWRAVGHPLRPGLRHAA